MQFVETYDYHLFDSLIDDARDWIARTRGFSRAQEWERRARLALVRTDDIVRALAAIARLDTSDLGFMLASPRNVASLNGSWEAWDDTESLPILLRAAVRAWDVPEGEGIRLWGRIE